MAQELLSAPKSAIAGIEVALKRALFGCRACGQCLLSQSCGICPMKCPKGLRNGPCGGMAGGNCEVNLKYPCVWTRVRRKQDPSTWPLTFRRPVDGELFGTSSWLNYLTGADEPTRATFPLSTPLMLPRAEGQLAEALESGEFAISIEMRTPHADNPQQLRRRLHEAEQYSGLFDCICVTSHPGCMSLQQFCAEVSQASCTQVALPVIGRDIEPGSLGDEFIEQLPKCQATTLLALTGDHCGQRRVFPMDSTQILQALAYRNWQTPRPLFATALHTQTTPVEVALGRAQQKSLAGADVFFTQVLIGTDGVEDCLRRLQGISGKRTPVILGIPLIGSRPGLEALARLSGIDGVAPFFGECRQASSLCDFSMACAEQLVELAFTLRPVGVAGVHVMPFGAPPEMTIDFRHRVRRRAHASGRWKGTANA